MTKSRGIQNTWSPAEEALLTEVWPQLGYACVSQFNGRSAKSVASKARAMKLKAPKARRGAQPKLRNYPAQRAPADIARFAGLGRNAPAFASIWHFAKQQTQGEQA